MSDLIAKKDGERLDRFLAGKLKDVSRTTIQKAIKAGGVLLNGKQTLVPHVALATGDAVTLPASLIAPPKEEVALAPRPDIALDIVYEDDDFAVINKPPGLLMHPSHRDENDTLANAMIAHAPSMKDVGESTERPGIMQRLDKDASGLVVVAKTDKAYRSLKLQFKKHAITKEYAVLVHSRPPKDKGTITLSLGRAKSGGRMAARHEALEGDRDAVTHYNLVELFEGATLLAVRTETGRTHQIRAHFKAIGCPVAGDPLYKIRRLSPLPAPRLFLHATMLGFKHPTTRKAVEFRAELPPDLEAVLAELRKKR